MLDSSIFIGSILLQINFVYFQWLIIIAYIYTVPFMFALLTYFWTPSSLYIDFVHISIVHKLCVSAHVANTFSYVCSVIMITILICCDVSLFIFITCICVAVSLTLLLFHHSYSTYIDVVDVYTY